MACLHFVSSAKIMSNKTSTTSHFVEEAEPSCADLSGNKRDKTRQNASTSLKLNLQGVLSGLPKNTSLGFGSFLAECQGVAWKSSRAGKALPCVAAGSAAVTFHCQQDDCEKQNHSTEQQGKDNVTPGIVLQAGHCQKRDKGWNMRNHCAS